MISRRNLIQSGGLCLAWLTSIRLTEKYVLAADNNVHVIKMKSDLDGARVWFDPVGLFVEPGARIRWIVHHNTHNVAAYHPDNDNHSLRIPPRAKSWNSGYLVEPGESFDVVLTEPGVYDYYCEPHEVAGMVGRIVVGEISGPGALPFDYFKKRKPAPEWLDIPAAAQYVFPDPGTIFNKGVVRDPA